MHMKIYYFTRCIKQNLEDHYSGHGKKMEQANRISKIEKIVHLHKQYLCAQEKTFRS